MDDFGMSFGVQDAIQLVGLVVIEVGIAYDSIIQFEISGTVLPAELILCPVGFHLMAQGGLGFCQQVVEEGPGVVGGFRLDGVEGEDFLLRLEQLGIGFGIFDEPVPQTVGELGQPGRTEEGQPFAVGLGGGGLLQVFDQLVYLGGDVLRRAQLDGKEEAAPCGGRVAAAQLFAGCPGECLESPGACFGTRIAFPLSSQSA